MVTKRYAIIHLRKRTEKGHGKFEEATWDSARSTEDIKRGMVQETSRGHVVEGAQERHQEAAECTHRKRKERRKAGEEQTTSLS